MITCAAGLANVPSPPVSVPRAPLPPAVILKDLLNRFRPRIAWLAALLAAAPLSAQTDLRLEMGAGGEGERYLRVLQVAGEAPLYPWAIRGFSAREVDRLVPDSAGHPWSARLAPRADSAAPRRLRLVRPSLDGVFNSAFPQGSNDGPVWAGRGVTVSASAGAQLRAGPLTLRVEPIAFVAQNADFELMPNGRPEAERFMDAWGKPNHIDLPQRYGDGAYGRIDPGNSTLRLDGRGFAAGVSTANQVWGPGADQPMVLGTNGPGFPHAFVGTSSPWKVGIGRVHGRIVWGSLSQSEYSIVQGEGSRRFMSGIVASFLPYGLDGLEVGVLRFFHDHWPTGGLDAENLARPLEGLWKVGLKRDEPGTEPGIENQLASAYFRWVVPRGGLEAYGEYTIEDHNWDALDFFLEPGRKAGYMVGGRRVWRRGSTLLSLRAEWVDTQPRNVNRVVNTGLFYRHSRTPQGHTVRGQLLGSPAAKGGGGSVVALEGYTPRGRWSVDWTRTRVASPYREYFSKNVPDPKGVDVVQSLGGELLWFRGGFDLLARVRGSLELNRYFAEDAFNLHASLGVRLGL
jgi:hypothetical protein